MKKTIVFLLSIMLFMSTTGFASTNIPEELMKTPENFTAATSISITIDDNSDIRNLIEEIAETDMAIASVMGGGFFDLLSAVFEYDGTVDIQADVSPDYKKIKLSLTNSNVMSSVVSSNLNYTVKAKSGIWADIDLTDAESPKCDVIFLLPTSDKYRYINAGKYITQENTDEYNEIFNSDELKKMTEEISQLLYDKATIEETETGYKFYMSNDNFAAYMDEIVRYGYESDMEIDEEELPTFKNMQFLGKDGITAVYTIKNGKISSEEVKADIAINISDIVKSMGEEWPYESSGIIKIKLSEKIDYTQIGTTVVSYPDLNDGNSIYLNTIIDEQLSPDNSYELVVEYPRSYIQVNSSTLPVVNGEYYIPLRNVLERGYDDTVSLDFQKGVVTASCDFFPEFNTIKMTVGDDKAYIDGTEYEIGTVMCIDGVTYVSTRLFTEVFGWELYSLTHDILENNFSAVFWTIN